MPDVSKTIEVIFYGTDTLSSTINTAGKNLSSFGDGITDIGQPFADATKQVLALSAAVTGLAVAGLAASVDLDREAKKMAGSLGLPIAEAEKFKDIAKDVYSSGFGDDLSATFDAVTLAQKKFGENASVDIGKVTTQAFKLQETFGTEYQQSLSAVSSLMKNFGLTSDEAFNFISAGYQKGLDGSGDFLESITEYGVQFKDGGANAGQFFSIMETGFIDGVAGTDKAADAFKEFRVRIQDDSKGTAEALASIGIDNAELQKGLNSGALSAIEAFQQINAAIQTTDDKGVAFRAGVGLMGTQFEDMGTQAALSLDLTKTKITDLSGAMGKVDTENLSKDFNSFYRTVITGIADNDAWDPVKTKLSEIFAGMSTSFKEAFGKLDLSALETQLKGVWDTVSNALKDANLDLTTVKGMQHAIDLVVQSIGSLAEVTKGIVEVLSPLAITAIKIIDSFNSMDSSTKNLIGTILGLGTSLAVVGSVVSTGGSLVSGIGSLAGLFAKEGKLSTGITSIVSKLGASGLGGAIASAATGPAGMVALAGAAGVAAGSLINLIPGVTGAAQGFFEFTDEVLNWTGTKGDVDGTSTALEIAMNRIKATAKETENLNSKFDGLTDEQIIRIKLDEAGIDVIEKIEKIPETKDVSVKVDVNDKQVDTFSAKLPNEYGVTVLTNADLPSANAAKDTIENIVPDKKDVKIKTDLDDANAKNQLDKFKIQADLIQNSLQYKAEVDISEIQAAAQVTQAAFGSINEGLTSSADIFGSLSGALSGATTSQSINLQAQLEKEGKRRSREIDLQEKLIDAQISYYESKVEAAERGDALIKIDGTGLQPHLESIMWEVLAAIQVRANEEGQAALLGLTI